MKGRQSCIRRHERIEGETMCGNIKKLRQPDQVPSDEELRLAALQFVRMVSGYRVPAAVNEAAFNTAVEKVAAATRELFDHLVARGMGVARGASADFSNGAVASNRLGAKPR
jgi:hypothetical protein